MWSTTLTWCVNNDDGRHTATTGANWGYQYREPAAWRSNLSRMCTRHDLREPGEGSDACDYLVTTLVTLASDLVTWGMREGEE